MLLELLEPEFFFQDERGKLIQLFSSGWKQVNISYTKEGVERGSHYHKKNREVFYIIQGNCILSLEDLKTGERLEQVLSTNSMVVVNPYVMHTFKYIEDTIMLAAYDIGFLLPDKTKDVFVNS